MQFELQVLKFWVRMEECVNKDETEKEKKGEKEDTIRIQQMVAHEQLATIGVDKCISCLSNRLRFKRIFYSAWL